MGKFKWDYDATYQEALKYKTRSVFAVNNGSAYQAAIKKRENGKRWIDDYYWFEDGNIAAIEKRTYWTKERLLEECRKYPSLAAIRNTNSKLYNAFKKHHCDKDEDFNFLYTSKNIYKDKLGNVYTYIFEEHNAIYVGISIKPRERDYAHRDKKNSSVNRFATLNNIPIPQMTIIKTDITPAEALEWEDYYVKKYREEGWNVLNRAKTGIKSGALGGGILQPKIKEEYVCEIARQYTTLKDFENNHPNLYNKAKKEKWLIKWFWLKKQRQFKEPVVKLTMNNELCGWYEDAKAAAKTMGANYGSNISLCCNGKQTTAYGCKWQYQDNYLADWWEENMENIAA